MPRLLALETAVMVAVFTLLVLANDSRNAYATGQNGHAQTATVVTDCSGFVAHFSGSQEVPPNLSTATGIGWVRLSPGETHITTSVTYSGLSGYPIDAHIHGPAPAGSNAPVIFSLGLTYSTSGTLGPVTFPVDPLYVAQLKAGLWYLDVHSTTFFFGEIRGQLSPGCKTYLPLIMR